MRKVKISPNDILTFSDDFVFGAAVSAFQVEGDTGERHTDWDDYLKRHPDIIHPHEKGPNWWIHGAAEEDIKRLSALGVQSLRFSIEWARIEPEEGKINHKAIIRYRQIVDYMKLHHIRPILTANHFTLPSWVAKKGGWEYPGIKDLFVRYIEMLLPHFNDIQTWITINEPSVMIEAGYIVGVFPPQKHNLFSGLKARSHILEAHKAAYKRIKDTFPTIKVGMAFAFRWYKPGNTKSPIENLYTNTVNYLDSLNYVDATKNDCDFIGCNFYSGYYLNLNFTKHKIHIWDGSTSDPKTILFGETRKPGSYVTDMNWPVVPSFLLAVLRTLHKQFKKEIIITENGIADNTDHMRAFYILTHLIAMNVAIQEGIKITGYLHWSAIDNLEWQAGYDKRFGLIKVNPITGIRHTHHSALLYKHVITHRDINIPHLAEYYLSKDQQAKLDKFIIKHINEEEYND
jgi:beta-glucosidase